jgi:hypothetical protein
MGLTLVQIDRLLTDWQQKVDAANQNLIDLYDLPAYQRLNGMGNPPSNVTGVTQVRASAALTALDRLFENIELLTRPIILAQKLRRELPTFFVNDQDLQEIERLLTGESIQLSSIQTPLAQRGLLSSSQQTLAISPSELLERMMASFTIARDTLVAIETAWTQLESKLIDTHQLLIELQQLARTLQVSVSGSVLAAETKFTELQLQIERDPLGVNDTFTQDLLPTIERSRSELIALDRHRQQLTTDFITARQDLDRLNRLNREAIDVAAETRSKIQHDLPLSDPIPAAELTELALWLERLSAKYAAGIIAPVRVGLTNWLDRKSAYLTFAESALAANRLPLDTRQELRGRLDALAAKALAKGKVEDPLLTDLALRARQVLYTSPTDLTVAIDLVREYERGLNQRWTC